MKLLLILILLFFYTTVSATNYYISAAGNDTNTGLSTSTPWKTITRVNAAFTNMKPGDQILFNRGDTFYGSLVISKSGASGSPITIGAYGSGENPIITGFTTVTGWTNLGNNIWESTNAVSTLSTCNMVVINGANTPMGRIPNAGFYTYQTHNANLSITSSNLTGTPNWTGAEVVIKKEAWMLHRATITSQSGATISYTDKEKDNWIPRDGWGFFIQNDLKTLDTQNEWYYNPTTKKISIYSTSQPNNVNVATVDKVVSNLGSYITFDNLQITGGNIYGIYSVANYLTVKNCYFSFIGLESLSTNWSSYLYFENNRFKNINDIAINTLTRCNYETIINNVIDSTSLIDGAGQLRAPGAIMSAASNSLIQYNSIDHSGYNGILTSSASGQIKNNFINNSCLRRTDGGGIYTGGTKTNLIIDGNIILNSIGNREGTTGTDGVGAEGIYLDISTTNTTLINNICIGHEHYGIMLSRSHDITITSNTCFDNKTSQLDIENWSSSNETYNININDNIFVAKTSTQLVSQYRSAIDNIRTFGTASNNIYARPIDDNATFRTGSPAIYSGGIEYKTLAQWQTYSGQDANSRKSQQSISNENELQLVYNASQSVKTISLAKPMIDVKGTKYGTSVTLQPWTSVVLMKDLTAAVVPSAPTSVVATAGNARASVSFVAPVNTGGSGITGYTVTSNPSGGVDSNAGSTSLNHTITGLTNGTSYTFTVKATNAVGTSVASAVSNSVTPKSTTATSFSFTGPSSGNVNTTSSNFTVTPNNLYTGTITITPSGVGSFGISNVVLTFSNSASSQTFTIRPTVAGNITLTASNNGGLTNPSSLTYVSNAVVPSAPTSVVATAGNARASVSFVAPVNTGGSGITGYTVTSNPSGGVDSNAGSTSLNHTITGLTNGTSYTFTVKATNAVGTSVASAVSNSVTPKSTTATSFTLTGPSSGNVNTTSSNFTVTPNNLYTGTITITPSGVGSTGISNVVLTFSNSASSQTFTIRPTVAGSITLTTSNNGGLTNPSSLTYVSNAVVPSAPTSVVATAGNARASVSFVAPVNNGGSSITGYTVTSIPSGGVDSNAGSTSLNHTITGLTNGTSYTFTVKATNAVGTSVASAVSNSTTPYINSIKDIIKIGVYPNPSKGNFTVQFSAIPEAGSRIEILSISGRTIASRIISDTSEEFNLGRQKPGIYMVKIVIGLTQTIHKLIIY